MMLDTWLGSIDLSTAALLFSVFVLLPIQLWLCFKVRSRILRLLPAIVFAVLTVALYSSAITASGWDGLAFIVLAILAGFMLLVCGLGWAIWAITRAVKKRSGSRQ